MNIKVLTGLGLSVLLVAGASFYAGMQYASASRVDRFAQGGANGQFAGRAGAGPRAAGASGGFIGGTIVGKDETSLTVELNSTGPTGVNGSSSGSKIILFNPSTQVGKFSAGSEEDLKIGDSVTIQGAPNADGSITAQMIQIRPDGTEFSGRGQ